MKSGLLVVAIMGAGAAPLAAQSDPSPRREVIYVEPGEQDYVGMILAATAWAKGAISKSLGVLQRDEAAPAWKRGIEAAAKAHDLKTIAVPDFTLVCFTRQASRSAPVSRTCSMKGAEAVLQFNSLRVAGDSGAMVTTVTRVPKGGQRTETTHHCIAFVRKGVDWETVRSNAVEDPDKCF